MSAERDPRVDPAPSDLPDGYYRVEGLADEYPRYWHVKTHQDAGVNDGRPYVCAWGLSLWGPGGETPTWAYRTFGNFLSILRTRFPVATWTPDHDRGTEPPPAPRPSSRGGTR